MAPQTNGVASQCFPGASSTLGNGPWLAPTPIAGDGAPPRVPAVDGVDGPLTQSPIIGPERQVDGVEVHEVTFVYEHPSSAGSEGVDAMVHLNGLTDNHRENVEPALLKRIPGTSRYMVTYLLPADGAWGYRLVVREHIPHDIGTERAGWMGIHRDGVVDPLCSETLRHPHGEMSSVLRMPKSPRRREFDVNRPTTTSRVWSSAPLGEIEPGIDVHWSSCGIMDAPALVMFDAEQVLTLPLLEAIEASGHQIDVIAIESGTSEHRGAVLPNPERVTARVERALQVVAEAMGRTFTASDVIVSGASYGGLASAALVIHHPEVAPRAIVQSGSFWHDPAHEGAPRREMTDPGALTRCVRNSGSLPGRRLVLHVGTDEGEMALQTRLFAEAAEAACIDVSVRQYRGGHDWAWWSHALLDGLDSLMGPRSS